MLTVMTAPTKIVSQILLQKGFAPPIQVPANIADFLNSPSLMARIREVSKSFNSMITANTRENRYFWNQHTADRWGYKYNYGKGGPFKRGIQDRIALYAQLDRLENAALRHLILHNKAQIHIFGRFCDDCYAINDISQKYFSKGKKTTPGWKYFSGVKALLNPNFESRSYRWQHEGLEDLKLSEKQGYKVGEDRYEIAVECLIGASRNSMAAGALHDIQNDVRGFENDKNWKTALSRINSTQVNDSKKSTCCQLETAAKMQVATSLPLDVFRHIFSFFKPKQLASFRAVAQYFNTWVLENSETNRLFWDGLELEPPAKKLKQ